MIPHFDFGDITAGEIGGRECLVVDVVPRKALDEHRGPFPVVIGGDAYQVWLDTERGTALRIEASWEGKPFSIREALDVVFDADLPRSLFEFDPPSGAPVFTTEDQPDHREVNLEVAARLAPFTVLKPTRLPRRSWLEVSYSGGGGFFGEQPSVSLSVWDEDQQLVAISESADTDADEERLEWRSQERDGIRYLINDQIGQRMVKVDLHGTRATVSGPHEVETLLEIAASLQPVSKTPPKLGE